MRSETKDIKNILVYSMFLMSFVKYKLYEEDFLKKYKKLCAVLLLLLIISIPLATFFGTAEFSFKEVVDVYRYHMFGDNILEDMNWDSIIWNLRFPRILVAIAVGGGLAITGTVIQAMTNNVMAEPYTLGIQSGAGMFAAFGIAFLNTFSILSFIGVKVLAFIGAMISMFLVYAISSRDRNRSVTTLILTGISISMLCNAATQLIISFAPDNAKVRGIVFWMMGGLGGSRWEDVPLSFIVFVIGFVIVYILAEQLNIISMGFETATILGVQTRTVYRILFFVVSMIVGVLVSISGSIGFVGLIIPHISRRIIGANHRALLPFTALLGSLFLVWADTVARTIAAPKELPIGVLTSLVGVPMFLFIMKKRNEVI